MASLLTLRTKARKLIGEEDNTNTHFTDAEIDSFINQATEFLATSVKWPLQVSTATAVTDQALYTLPSDFISLIDVYIDNKPLTIVDRVDLKSISSGWQDSSSSTPRYCYKADNAVIGLWPAPNSDSNGDTIQIQYVNTPASLSADVDVPDLHSAFQICVPFYAAFMCELSLDNNKKADIHYKLYKSHLDTLTSKVEGFSDSMRRFTWPK